MKKLCTISLVLSLFLLTLAWCGNKHKIQTGDIVSITYTAHFSDGTLFDENTEKNPLLFAVGERQTIAGIDDAVVGMKVGKKKKVTITPDKGYWILYSDNLVQKIGKIIFDRLEMIPEVWTIQKLDNLEWVIRAIEMDESGNEVVLFDINARQTWDTLTYKITILAKQE